jgi:hypothetical protein
LSFDGVARHRAAEEVLVPRASVASASLARALGAVVCAAVPCAFVGMVAAQTLDVCTRATRSVAATLAAIEAYGPTAAMIEERHDTSVHHVRAPSRAASVAAPPSPADVVESVRAVFCGEAARRACRARVRCGCVEPASDCEWRVEAGCSNALLSTFGETAFPIEPDTDALARCLRGFDAIGDECTLEPWSRDCEWPLREPVEVGEHCEGTRACRNGWCDDGVCRARVARGVRPTDTEICAVGTTRVGGMCERPGGLEDVCAGDIECAQGLYCLGARCARRRERGEFCYTTDECEVGLRCASRRVRGRWIPNRCTEPPSPWCEPGVACGADSNCRVLRDRCVPCDGECHGASLCDDGSRCPDGSTCEPGEQGGRCEPQLCDPRALAEAFG